MCPTDMQPYIDAHEVEMDEKDFYIHSASAVYGTDVIGYTLDHILNGNKAKSKVEKLSIRQKIQEQKEKNRPLTQDEIVEATKEYFRRRKIDKMNFDLAQIEKKRSEE